MIISHNFNKRRQVIVILSGRRLLFKRKQTNVIPKTPTTHAFNINENSHLLTNCMNANPPVKCNKNYQQNMKIKGLAFEHGVFTLRTVYSRENTATIDDIKPQLQLEYPFY